jgi:hypothetical protein
MRDRQTPRPVPSDGLHFAVDVPDRGLTHWRLPFPIYSARLLAGWSQVDDTAVGDAKMAEVEKVWRLGGAAVGLCWADPDRELEAVWGDDLHAYGDAVLSELQADGWTVSQLAELYPALFRRLSASVTVSAKEVSDRVGFSAARRGPFLSGRWISAFTSWAATRSGSGASRARSR